MTIEQKRDELIVAVNRAGVVGAIRDGKFDALCEDVFDKVKTIATATGTQTLDVQEADEFDLTLTGNTTIAFTNLPVLVNQSRSWVVRVRQGGTLRTLTWPTVTWYTEGGVEPADPAIGKLIEYIFSTQDGVTVVGRKGSGT